jgi:spermidine synthase
MYNPSIGNSFEHKKVNQIGAGLTQLLPVVLMLLSGAAGLVWQLLWTAQLGLTLGHEMVAVLAVLAAYFGGLSLGAFALDARIQASAAPARWYAGLELVVASWALLLSLLLPFALPFIAPWLGSEPNSTWHWTLAFVTPFILLLPATVAMGATLPALDKQLRFSQKLPLGLLYGANTMGAMLGVLLAVFVFLPQVGFKHTAWIFAGINGLCAMVALWCWRAGALPSAPISTVNSLTPDQVLGVVSQTTAHISPKSIGISLFATGFLGISYEILCVRVLSQVTENTVYTYAVLLAVYLLGTALGAWAYQRYTAKGKVCTVDTLLSLLAVSMAMSGASLWAANLLCDAPARWWGASWGTSIAGEALAGVAAMLLPTFVMGALFTQLCEVAAGRGLSLGPAMSINTLGGTLAPLLVGAALIPWLGARLVLCMIVVAYFLLSSSSSWLEPRRWVALIALGIVAVAAGPLRFVDVPPGGRVISYQDGIMASVSVVEDDAGVSRLHINNRVQEGSSASGQVEVRLAQLPLLMHPAPHSALFLGLGTGYTAHAAAVDPRLKVQAIELLPEVVSASRLFAMKPGAPAAGQPVQVSTADARRFIQSTALQYDVVVSDLFHPARSGAASLYTVEHFSAVRQRLLPGGVFCQWLALHQMDLVTLRSIVAGFMQVYPKGIALLASNSLDTPVIGLVGRADDAPIRAQDISARLATLSPAQVASLKIGRIDDVYSVLGSVLAGPEVLQAYVQGVVPNTDDHPSVAYRAPWALQQAQNSPRARLRELLVQWTPQTGPWLENRDTDISNRLTAYWQARKNYLELGMRVQAVADPVQMLKQLQTPLLKIVAQSPDFRPASEPLQSLAGAVRAAEPALAEQVLTQLHQAQQR